MDGQLQVTEPTEIPMKTEARVVKPVVNQVLAEIARKGAYETISLQTFATLITEGWNPEYTFMTSTGSNIYVMTRRVPDTVFLPTLETANFGTIEAGASSNKDVDRYKFIRDYVPTNGVDNGDWADLAYLTGSAFDAAIDNMIEFEQSRK